MRMRWFVVVALVVAGCKKEKAASPPAPAPKPPASTAEQDALWKLAPDGATVGIVVSSHGLKSIESGWFAIKKLIAAAPELASVSAKVDAELTKTFGSPNVSLADVGMAPGKGAALFTLEGGDEIVFLPVVDRDKFLKVAKGTKGTDSDTVDDHTCKTVQNLYACAKPADLLARIGKGPMGDKITFAGARGDLEIAGGLVDKSGQMKPIQFAGVAQLDRGAVVVRGAMQGVMPEQVTSKLKTDGKPQIDPAKAAGFAFLNLAAVLEHELIPPDMLAPGVTLADLAGSIRDPQTIVIAPGGMVLDVRVPLADTAPAQKLIEQCESVPALAMLGAKLVNGACHAPVPQLMTELDAWVEGKELRIGKKGAPASTVTVAPRPVATELLEGKWAFAMFGRGTLLGEGQIPQLPMGQMPDEARAGIRMMMMLNELGFGVRVDGDTVRFILDVRTAWSNPDDVVAKLVAIDPTEVLQGKASATAKQIAAASPSSPFAEDYKAGLGGLMIPTAVIGVIAGVAVPAFMNYLEKSKGGAAAPTTPD